MTIAPASDVGVSTVKTSMSGNSRTAKTVMTVLLSVAVLGVTYGAWEAVARLGLVSPLILPVPEAVWAAIGHGIIQGAWLNDLSYTIQESLAGFGIAVILATVVGAIFAYSEILRRAFFPYMIALQTFPKIAVAPLLVALLGYGMAPKIIISSTLAFFPIYINTVAGFLEIDGQMVDLFRTLRASKLQELFRLRLPNAISYIVPSLDVALVLALLGAIAAELAGGTQVGLGNIIQQRSFMGDTPSVYACCSYWR